MKIRIGSRKSELAIIQTKIVIEEINKIYPSAECEIVGISTQGDKNLDKPLIDLGGKGVFVSEFETAILEGKVDLAVHSGKDLPTNLADGLDIVATPKREDVRDVIVSRKDMPFSCDRGGLVGTGSARRAMQISDLYTKVRCEGIRGNVPTRIKKMEIGEFDALILAAAGLNRLGIGIESYCFEYLEPKTFIPAAAQGIIAVEGKKGSEISKLVSKITDLDTEICFKAERSVLMILGADCHEAIGIYSFIEDGEISIYGFLGKSGIKSVKEKKENWLSAAKRLAGELK